MRYNQTTTDFSYGEVSEKLRSRIDSDAYKKGLRILENFIPLPSGGVTRRPGTVKISENFDPTITAYSSTVYYISDSLMANVFVTLKQNIGGDVVPTAYWYQYGEALVTLTLDLPTNLLNLDAYDFSSLEADEFNFYQQGLYLFVTHRSSQIPPFIISYVSGTPAIQWLLYGDVVSNFELTLWNHHFDPKNQNIDLQIKFDAGHVSGSHFQRNGTGETGTVVVVDSSGNAVNNFFGEDLVGAILKIENPTDPTQEAVVYLTDYDSNTPNEMDFIYIVNCGATPTTETPNWKLSTWNPRLGFPRTCAGYMTRICFGGTVFRPSTVWCSAVNTPFMFNQELLAQDLGVTSSSSGFTYFDNVQLYNTTTVAWPFNFSPANAGTAAIQWMTGGAGLFVGNNLSEHIVTAVSGEFSIAAINIRTISSFGSRGIQPIQLNDGFIFISRDGKRLVKMHFSDADGTFTFKELSFINSEILFWDGEDTDDSTISLKSGVWVESYKTLFLLNTANQVVSITLADNDTITSWARHSFGDIEIQAMSAITRESSGRDTLIFIADRESYVGGNAVSQIEILEDFFTSRLTPLYLDFQNGIAATHHADGTKLTFDLGDEYADRYIDVIDSATGTNYNNLHVNTSNTLIVPTQMDDVYVGYRFSSKLRTLPIEAGQQFGSSAGNITRIDHVNLMVYKSSGFQYGTDINGLYDAEFDEMPYTGDLKVDFPANPDKINEVWVVEERPVPLTILGMTIRGVSYED